MIDDRKEGVVCLSDMIMNDEVRCLIFLYWRIEFDLGIVFIFVLGWDKFKYLDFIIIIFFLI